MVAVAKEVLDLDLYNEAFDLIHDWVKLGSAKIIFFRTAVEKMITTGVSHEKIMQLGKKIGLTEAQILNEALGFYALSKKEFACQLAKHSDRPDSYYEIIFSALLNEGKSAEAEEILKFVSPAKKEDLKIYISKKALKF